MRTWDVTILFRVRPQTQETYVWVIRMCATFLAERSRVAMRMSSTLGPRPFRWRRPRWWRWEMMTSTKTRRRRWRVSWRMTRLAMRVRSPGRRSGGSPSKPLSHAGPEGPTRGSRATPESTCRWRKRRRVAAPMTAGARGPRSGGALWARTTFWGTTVLGPCAVWAGAIGSSRPATAGRGVLRHPRATVPSSGAVTGGPLAGTASSARGAACSFWTGLMLSPWRWSLFVGVQLTIIQHWFR